MITRTLWNGRVVPALGLGCWAIGGPFYSGTTALGWGEVDDAESIRAIDAAVERGVRLFDTAQAYGTGHSETVLGSALSSRTEVLVSSKVGYRIDRSLKQLVGAMESADEIEASIHDSLRRLKRDTIDIVFLHLNALDIDTARIIFDRLDQLREKGKVASFGWSTDYPDRAKAFADMQGFVAIQHAMNVFFRAEALIPVIERHNLLSFNRSPLAMGLLSGKYTAQTQIGRHDVRGQNAEWIAYFKGGKVAPEYARMFEAVRELLQSDGRTLVQGALGWLWARSSLSVPLPGFRTVAQVNDLCGALEKGPLSKAVVADIERVISRPPEGEPRDR
jgi:aryl-alcohol dehydrogenase-like predicted oxidoreductase